MEKIEFDAVPLSMEQVEKKFINELANGHGGVARRIGLAVLSKSSDHFYDQDMTDEAAEAFICSVGSLGAYIDLLGAHLEMMESARARITAILNYRLENQGSVQ